MDKERLIANYFLDVLSEDEKRQFDEFLKTDSDFKKEFEFQKAVKQTVIKKEHDNLKRQLQNIESQIKVKKTKKVKKTWWVMAASVILLVSLSLYFSNNDNSNEALFAEFYEPAKNIVHPIVRNGEYQDDVSKAFIAYQKQDYKLAQELFHSVFVISQKSELLFYEGIALIETNLTDLAIQKLEEHKNYSDALSEKTNWYLAMAFLKNEDKTNAQVILKEISSDASNYKFKEARALLKKL